MDTNDGAFSRKQINSSPVCNSIMWRVKLHNQQNFEIECVTVVWLRSLDEPGFGREHLIRWFNLMLV